MARPNLGTFRRHVYGRVPTTPYEKQFKVVKEDPRYITQAQLPRPASPCRKPTLSLKTTAT